MKHALPLHAHNAFGLNPFSTNLTHLTLPEFKDFGRAHVMFDLSGQIENAIRQRYVSLAEATPLWADQNNVFFANRVQFDGLSSRVHGKFMLADAY